MLAELIRPHQRPVTNVVAVAVIFVTALPILAAYYLTREGEHVAGAGKWRVSFSRRTPCSILTC